MMTINSLCLFNITDFIDMMLEWKGMYGHTRVLISLNILRFPSFMSVAALPDHIKEERYNHISEWFEKNKDDSSFHEFELNQIKRLLSYLKEVDSAHSYVSDKEILWKDFKSFYSQYDIRRNKDINVFPEILTSWLDTIDIGETNVPPVPIQSVNFGAKTFKY